MVDHVRVCESVCVLMRMSLDVTDHESAMLVGGGWGRTPVLCVGAYKQLESGGANVHWVGTREAGTVQLLISFTPPPNTPPSSSPL